MIFPTLYAALVWASLMFIRVWWGRLIVLICAMLPIWLFGEVWNTLTNGMFYAGLITNGYAAIVGGVGLYICLLPPRPRKWECPHCRYDLRGIDGMPTCPECGGLLQPGVVARDAHIESLRQQAHHEHRKAIELATEELKQERLRAPNASET